MKKITKLLVTMFVVSMFMFGCGSSDEDTTVVDNASQQDVTVDGVKEGEQDSEDATTETETTDENIAIKGQELFSYEGLTVTINDITFDELWNEGVKVILENTSDIEYKVCCEYVAYNDYTVTASLGTYVKPGETVEAKILTFADFDFFGAEEVGQVSLYMTVKETTLANTVYESGEILLKTSKYDEIQVEKCDEGDVIYEADNIRIVSLGLVCDEADQYSLKLFVENNRNEPIVLSCSKANVNDCEVETLYYQNVAPNKMGVSGLVFYSSGLAANEITTIEDVEICFTIRNKDSMELIENTDIISVPIEKAE